MPDVPESVLAAFNRQLERYITVWTGTIRRHLQKLRSARTLRATKHSSQPVNDALVYRAVHHHIGVQRYALSFTGDAQSILDDAQQAIIEAVQSYADESGNIDPSKVDKMLADIAVIQDDARGALENELESELEEFVLYEAENEVETLSSELPEDVDLDMPTPDELNAIISDVAFQGRYIDDWLFDFSDANQSRTKAAIVGSLQSGLAVGAIVAALNTGSFLVEERQWENIVRTIWNGAANWAKGLVYQKNSDVISKVQWHATLDEVTSFPAGTLVSTPSGEVPIEQIADGQFVSTPVGPRCVLAVHRYRARGLLRLSIGGQQLRPTPDHRLLRVCGNQLEWCAACALRVGDQVCQIAHAQDVQSGAFYIGLPPAYDAPTMLGEEGGLAGVARCIAVPVLAVDFEGEACIEECEIDAVASDFVLLREAQAGGIERIADGDLQSVWPAMPPIASEAAKADFAAWTGAKFLFATRASKHARRAATGFAAKLKTALVGIEKFAAAWAVRVLGRLQAALARTDGVAISVAEGDGVGLTADGAELCYAIRASWREACLSAVVTVAQIARHWQRRIAGKAKTLLSPMSHGETVYCLSVAEANAFFAHGLLVHNCPICAALDGQVFDVDELDPPPAHPSCRCFITAVIESADRIARISHRHARAIRRAHPDHQRRLTGKPAYRLRYVDWLKRQSAEVQDEALGPTRGRLFRLGHMDIRKFANSRRQRLTLDQLRKRDAAAFERARIAA